MKLPITIAIAATLLLACQEPTCACPPGRGERIRFIGSVTRASGPITDAEVAVTLNAEDCRVGDPVVNNPNDDRVNAGGNYEILVEFLRRGPYCARLVARWPGDSAIRDSIRVVAPSRDPVVVDFDVP
jgi:hypothetical protein